METVDYSGWKPDDLLTALERAGRHPAPALLEACLRRGAALVPGLLALLAADHDETWTDDDPRWYGCIHAGLILIERREEAALPVFETIYRDPEREEFLGDWFSIRLPLYGPALVPHFSRIAGDEQANEWSRISAVSVLNDTGRLDEAAREPVIAFLRTQLPPLRDDGTLLLPDPSLTTEEAIAYWTWVVSGLADLRDEASREQALALFDAGLVDESVLGDRETYLDILAGREEFPAHESITLQEFYARTLSADEAAPLPEDESDEMIRMMEQIQQKTGWGEAEMEAFVAQLSRHVDEEGNLYEEDVLRELDRRLASAPQRRIGRNERVTIRDPRTGRTETLKYKHAIQKLEQGWELVHG